MKFILWGAGARGRRLFRFLTVKRVVAYIDNCIDLHGKSCDGIPIISFDYYLAHVNEYKDVWIVVTPLLMAQSIFEKLQLQGIYNYLDLRDCPDAFYDYKSADVFSFYEDKIKDDIIHMYGLNLFNLFIANYLADKEKTVYLIVNKDKYNQYVKYMPCKGRTAILCEENCMPNLNVYIYDCTKKTDIEVLLQNKCTIRQMPQFNILKSKYENHKLIKFKNMFYGKRCFIVATGPSLKMQDLDVLHEHKELCISLNKIYLAYPDTKWRPDFYVMTDPALNSYKKIIDSMQVKYKIISDNNLDFWDEKHPDNVYRVHIKYAEKNVKFSDDLTEGIFSSCNVTYACIQLAVYLGCQEIYLLGVDFSNLLNIAGRQSHFRKDYDGDEELVNGKYPLETIYTDECIEEAHLRGYQVAQQYAVQNGIHIYNATRGGKLEVFKRINFDSLFKE